MSQVSLRLLAPLIVLLTGCVALPPYRPGPPEHAIADAAHTRLGRLSTKSLPSDQPTYSGFRLLPEGEAAFNARIALARHADQSLDVQYYLITRDDLGLQFLRELRDAALRGVRVRLLIDDLYTSGEDDLLSGLAAYPNVQVRLFNPLPARGGWLGWRLLSSMPEFGRVNHRMHNKLFIADNCFAVSGGRNIAEAYFMHSPTANFIDLDVLASGPVVPELSDVFDSYWNSVHARPIESLTERAPPEAERRHFDDLVGAAGLRVVERSRDVLGQTPVARQLEAGELSQTFGSARVIADSPKRLPPLSLMRAPSR